jgi:aldehyde:ferredoxin oxidoreductase
VNTVGKILRVNLSDLNTTTEDLSESYTGLGGRGLASAIVKREVPPLCDALGLDNKLVFAPGILAAKAVPNNGRLSVGAKSPLTGGIKEANSGGSAALKLAHLGLSAVILEGIAVQLCIMRIHKNGVAFIPSPTLVGLGTYDLMEKLKEEYGKKVAIIGIGPAGEMMLTAASIAVTGSDFNIRIGARGGLGAVMGSKNIKAIVIDDERYDEIRQGTGRGQTINNGCEYN